MSPEVVPGSTWDPVDDELADLLPPDDAIEAAQAAEQRSEKDEEEQR